MATKTAILVAGTTGLHAGVHKAAKLAAAKSKALVTSQVSKIETLLKQGKLSKVVILMGARGKPGSGPYAEVLGSDYISVFDAYQRLLKCNRKAKYVLMDGARWIGVRSTDAQVIVTGKNTVELISQQL